MRYLEKLSEYVALDSTKPSTAELLSVLSHCLPSLYRKLPVTTVIFNNNGVYRGDPAGSAYSPTGLLRDAHYEKIIEAFGGAGYHVTDTPSLTRALTEALASGKPALINAVIDPTAGTESGHIQSLNPRSAAAAKK